MGKPLRVLIVEDSEDDSLRMSRALKKGGYNPVYERVETAEAMRAALREKAWDVILCDYQMPKFTGLTAIALLKETNIDIPLIIVSGAIGEETAVDCMRCGAHDYVAKSNLSRLVPAVEREMKEAESRVQHRRAEALSEGKRELKANDNAPVMMCVLDEGRRVLYANNAFTEYTGIPETELQKGRACGIFGCINALEDPRGCGFGENCKNCYIREAMEDTFRTGQSHQAIDYRAVFDIGGVRRAVILLGATALIKDLHPPKLLLCLQDITERKRVEYELSESERRYSVLFNAIDEGLCIIEMIVDENEKPIDFRFLEINPAFENQTGLIGAPGKRIRELVPKHEEYWFEVFGKVAETGQSARFVRRAEQLNRWYDVYAFPFGQPENRQVAILFNDISERKQMVDALRESEAKLAKGEQVAQLGYWDLDIKNQKLVWSKEVYRLFGKDPDTFVPTVEAFLAMIHPEDLGRVLRIRDDAIAGGSGFTVDYRIILSNNSLQFMQEIVELDRDGKGVLTRIFGTVQDITERKQAEEALRESEEKWRTLVSNSPDFIALHDREGKYLFLNHYSEGFMEKNVLGKNACEFVLQESRGVYRTAFEESIRTKTKQIAEYSAMGDYKKARIYESTFTPIVGHKSEINVLVVAKDITEHKQAEESLRESEKRYRSLFENSIMGISQAYPDGRLIVVNNADAQMYGYASAEEMMAEVPSVGKLYANPEDREEVLRILREEGVMKPREMAVVRRDGAPFTVLVGAREIRDSNGNLLYYQAEHIDITERKKAEEELRASSLHLRALAMRLQQIREEERVLIAREIHDEMGGGLAGLKMDLSWLLRKMGNADSDEARDALIDKIHASNALIDHMIRIVRRISTGLRPAVLDDLGLIAALEWQLAEFTSHTEVPHEFTTAFEYVNMEEDTAVAVFRIFQEALTNVLRHSQATKVAVVLREGERSLFGDESCILEIRDNGRGITEEEILNPKSLGLLGMKERVLTFGGDLSIRCEPGGGTTLVLKIPRKLGEEP
jgi:PAS domain S-box-containing protein